jgi:hypothetical protein
VYGDMQPAGGADALDEVPLLASHSAGHPQVGFAHGGHDVPQMAGEVCVVVLDVAPTLLAQDDAATVGIDRRREHRAIVAPVAGADNALLETRP